MKKHLLLFSLILSILFFAACEKDDTREISQVRLGLSITAPDGMDSKTIGKVVYTLTDVSTGNTQTFTPTEGTAIEVSVPAGIYHIDVEGKATTSLNDRTVESEIQGRIENLSVNGDMQQNIPTYIRIGVKGFVIAEIAIGGTLDATGDTYTGDSYFRIYNNSDETLYADGLVIAQTSMTTDDKQNYTPDLIKDAVTINVAYMIPGSGKDHPVKPGEFLLVCANARNHKEINPRSFDLSKADFEWYDNPDNDPDSDTDNPLVANLIPLIGYGTDWQPAVQGNHGYIIGFLGEKGLTPEQYIAKYKYNYSYILSVEGFDPITMEEEGYLFPNLWITDAVQLCAKEDYQWSVLSPSLDAGYTYMAESSYNNAQKCVRRKADKTSRKLTDTNNSSQDFEPVGEADPQHDFFH